MHKIRGHEIAIGFLIASALWALILTVQSGFVSILAILNEHKELVTALAAVASAAFAATIWWVNRKQLGHARLIERAYMSAGGTRLMWKEASSGYVEAQLHPTNQFEVHINNHGKTPGEFTQIAIGFCDAENIPPQPNCIPEPFHDWIGPGTQSRAMLLREIPPDVSAVYGRIYYRDIFDDEHSSGFLQTLPPAGGSSSLLGPPAYTSWD